jgi:hypothetical protein
VSGDDDDDDKRKDERETKKQIWSRKTQSVTEESRLQSILAISVVSTKNASLQSQSHFDYDGATIR